VRLVLASLPVKGQLWLKLQPQALKAQAGQLWMLVLLGQLVVLPEQLELPGLLWVLLWAQLVLWAPLLLQRLDQVLLVDLLGSGLLVAQATSELELPWL
jgi:hypothetical protein